MLTCWDRIDERDAAMEAGPSTLRGGISRERVVIGKVTRCAVQFAEQLGRLDVIEVPQQRRKRLGEQRLPRRARRLQRLGARLVGHVGSPSGWASSQSAALLKKPLKLSGAIGLSRSAF